MYFLIEEVVKRSYGPRDHQDCTISTDYFVTKCKSKVELKNKFIEGPKRGGKLLPAKSLEFKLQIIEEEEELYRPTHDPHTSGPIGQAYSMGDPRPYE